MKTRSALTLAALLVTLGGCGSEETETTPTPTEAAVTDLRIDIPEPPAGGLQFKSEIMNIPPYTEKQWCFFYDYEGPDVAIYWAGAYQATAYSHHAQIMISNADPTTYPAGTMFDCTSRESLPMTDMEPLYIGTDLVGPGHSEMNLPEGMAVSLKQGTRLILQSHYLNTSSKTIMVQDATNFGIMRPEDVETWAAPWVNTDTGFELPAGTTSTVEIHCTWQDEVYLLNMLGHMHEWGTRFALDHTRTSDGSVDRVYDIPVWDPQYRDRAPVTNFEADSYRVQVGDVFTTTCEWFNDTDHTIEFPEEMCVSVGMAYPAKIPLICEPD